MVTVFTGFSLFLCFCCTELGLLGYVFLWGFCCCLFVCLFRVVLWWLLLFGCFLKVYLSIYFWGSLLYGVVLFVLFVYGCFWVVLGGFCGEGNVCQICLGN